MRTPLTLPAGSVAAAAASAALRAVSAVVAGFALTSGLALLLWAVTPSAPADVSDATDAIRGGAVAFAAAHFLPVSISGTALTLRPLLATVLAIAVIATAVGRGRAVRGRALEALHASVFVLLYGIGVDVLVAAVAPSEAAQPGLGAPLALAALTALGSLVARPTAWRAWWTRTVPAYVTVAVRGAAVTVMGLICAAAVTLAVGMAVSFPEAAGIAELTIHSFGDALGMALICLAFLPNAVLAALGYLSGAGFSVGSASFSPLDVHGADLPAIPLLAAVPSEQPSVVTWIVFAGPVLAGLLASWMLRGVGRSRWQRIAAVVLTAAATGLACSLLTLAGGGGIAGGPWTSMGAPPWITGGLLAGIVLMVAASVTLPPGWPALPWRAGGPRKDRAKTAAVTGDRAAGGRDDDGGRKDADPVEAGAGPHAVAGAGAERRPEPDGRTEAANAAVIPVAEPVAEIDLGASVEAAPGVADVVISDPGPVADPAGSDEGSGEAEPEPEPETDGEAAPDDPAEASGGAVVPDPELEAFEEAASGTGDDAVIPDPEPGAEPAHADEKAASRDVAPAPDDDEPGPDPQDAKPDATAH